MELQAELLSRGVQTPLIMISGYVDIPMAVQAMQRGALDVLKKPLDDVLLLQRIRQALEKDATARRQRTLRQQHRERVASLSSREHQTLDLLVEGKSTKEIARILGISVKTVDCHRANVLEKMATKNIVELVRTLSELGMLHDS